MNNKKLKELDKQCMEAELAILSLKLQKAQLFMEEAQADLEREGATEEERGDAWSRMHLFGASLNSLKKKMEWFQEEFALLSK